MTNIVSVGAAAVAIVVTAWAIAEARDFGGWVSSRLIRRAARRLPMRKRQVKLEEWLGELEALDGLKIVKLFYGLGVYIAACRIAWTHRAEVRAERPVAAPERMVQKVSRQFGVEQRYDPKRRRYELPSMKQWHDAQEAFDRQLPDYARANVRITRGGKAIGSKSIDEVDGDEQ